jgi:hypothetical protein
VSFLLLLCLIAGAFTQSLTDAQKLDQAIALVKSVSGLTETGETNRKNILTRLETLKGQFVVVEPTPDPVPPPPPPVYVTQSTFDAALAEITARLAKLEAGTPTPEPTPTPTPTPIPPAEVCGNGIDDDKDGQIDEGCAVIPPPPYSTERNAYYDYLVARPDFWKGYSLRPKAGEPITSPFYEKQLLHKKNGGYSFSDSAPLAVNYDATMDAAKIVIPAFYSGGWTLARDVDATTTRLIPATWSSAFTNGRQVRIDNEVVLITAADASTVVPRGVTVQRGQYGTAAAAHATGAVWAMGVNSLPNGLRLPIQTENGHRYAFIWDVYYTDSYLNTGLTNHKAFQFSSKSESEQWLEIQTRFDGGSSSAGRHPDWNPAQHVAGVEIRGYNYVGGPTDYAESTGDQFGPNVTGKEPITPKVGAFNIAPNRWTRFVVTVDQQANDYDVMSFWVMDEVQAPVQIYKDLLVSVRGSTLGERILTFWVEFNTSTGPLQAGRLTNLRDLVAYMRNFAALRGVTDVAPLLQRPVR